MISLPLEADRAALAAVEAGDHVEERGLAGAVGPDQRGDRALLDVEGGAVHGQDAAEALDELIDLEDRRDRRLRAADADRGRSTSSFTEHHLLLLPEHALRAEGHQQDQHQARRS